MSGNRIIHTPEEIVRIRRAAEVTAAVRDEIARLAHPGMTTFELDQLAGELIARTGGKSAFKNYYGYPGNICISMNEVVVHGIGSPDQLITENDIVSIDVGVNIDGAIGDTALTITFRDDLPSDVKRLVSGTQEALAEGIAALVTALPQGFLFLLVTLISLVYFSLDYDRISDFIKSILPQKFVSAIEGIKSKSIRMLGKYLRSYSLIIFVTYMILLIGFLILRIKNALFVALFVSVLDILPIIGVGTLLIPWGILEIAIGNKFVGIGLIILFLVNAIVRQFLEPKIIGKSLNIHPIATLIMIYIGYSLFGIMGLIILPAIAIVLSIVLGGNKTAEIG
jgi:predicted PurR-regulated permease PerM